MSTRVAKPRKVAATASPAGESKTTPTRRRGKRDSVKTDEITDEVTSGDATVEDDEEKKPKEKPAEKADFLANAPEKERWKNWTVRTISSLGMSAFFLALLATGHVGVTLFVVVLQVYSFKEVVAIGYVWAKEKHIPLFRVINWYFLFVFFYLLYFPTVRNILSDSFGIEVPYLMRAHHSFVSFSLYMIGFVAFVLHLQQPLYKYQLGQFGLTHMTLLIVVFSSTAVIANVNQGLFWFVLPATLIIVNDTAAYIFGFFFGKTRLIQLSPKKTWEGFIGGAATTIVWGFLTSWLMAQFPYLTCPHEKMDCVPLSVFQPTLYHIPYVGIDVSLLPVQLHALAYAIFSSLLAPFGGFFASGVKRAFKIKDFGEFIPGHGGVVDRVDCQFMMGVFAYIYFSNFIKPSVLDIAALKDAIFALSAEDRAQLCGLVCGA